MANQMTQLYDQNALKTMSMWMDPYGYPIKEDKGIPMAAIQQQLAAFQASMASSNPSHRALSPPQRRKANPVPNENKDEAYYERRKKNNDSAKRSRENRRHKEQEYQIRAEMLAQENQALRHQIVELQAQLAKLQAMICSLQNQNFPWAPHNV